MFNKKNKVTFIANEANKYLPHPYPAYKEFPEWFIKSNPKSSKCPFMSLMQLNKLNGNFSPSPSNELIRLVKNSTVKNCPGIVDYLKTGYILPAWSDMVIRNIKGKMIIDAALKVSEMHYGIHSKSQFIGMEESQLPEMSVFHKMDSPWWIRTSPGVSVLITNPYWNRNKMFTSVSAVVHPDKAPIQLKWFFELNKTIENNTEIYDEGSQVIKKDTPLALIIPFKRESFEHSLQYLDDAKFDLMKREDECFSFSWFTDSMYDKFRKSFNIWYR